MLGPAGIETQHLALNWIEDWIGPAMYAAGAAACLAQSTYLSVAGRSGARLPSRMRRLAFVGAAMLALAAVEWTIAHDRYYAFTLRVLFANFGQFALLVLLGVIATRDYREERALIEKTPTSVYHRRPSLPERLHGAVLVVDLKNSERLFRLGAHRGEAGSMVEACLSHLWSAAIAEGGVVLQTEGDQLRAFFDSDEHAEPAASALRAADRMSEKLQELAERFADQGFAAEGRPSIDFRGGVAIGEIAPVWQEIGNTRYASWIEVGTMNPFVESARFMELERKLEGAPQDTVVVLAEDAARRLKAFETSGRWFIPGCPFEGKHGRMYRVVAYLPGPPLAAFPAADPAAAPVAA